MNYKVLTYKLLLLLVPAMAIIAWFSYDKGKGGIGGEYDLGDLYCTLIVITYILFYELITAVTMFYYLHIRKIDKNTIENAIAFGVGLIGLICAIIFFISIVK